MNLCSSMDYIGPQGAFMCLRSLAPAETLHSHIARLQPSSNSRLSGHAAMPAREKRACCSMSSSGASAVVHPFLGMNEGD